MSQSPLWFVVFLLTKFIYNPVGFLFQHRDPGSTRMWNQKFSLPAQRSGSTRTWNQKFPHQHRDPDLPGCGIRSFLYQDVEIRSFLTSTEARVCQDVESEVSSPAQRPGSARTRTQEQTGVSCVRLCYQWSRVFCRHRAARFTQ